jgi:hypothetical protein
MVHEGNIRRIFYDTNATHKLKTAVLDYMGEAGLKLPFTLPLRPLQTFQLDLDHQISQGGTSEGINKGYCTFVD